MSSPALNPYQAPLVEHKLTDSQASEIKRRDIGLFILLCIITLGLYWFYVGYQWSKELNGLAGRVKYQPLVFLIVNILTCGLAGIVLEFVYALDIANETKAHGIKDRQEQLAGWVIGLNCAAVIVSLIPFGVLLGLPLGTLASVLIQIELNKLADQCVA